MPETLDQIRPVTDPSVLHLITDAGPHPYFRTLIEPGGIDRGGVCVGCIGPAGALQDDMKSLGVSTFALGIRSRRLYPFAVARLVNILRRRHPEVLQTHLVDGCLVGLAAARLARTPVAVMTAHHSHELPFHGRRLLWPERLCAGPLCDHIIAPSRQVAESLVGLARVPADKIDVVHHGFDLNRLNPDGVDGSAVRRELGVDDKLVFGAVGRMYNLKNYAALITAFAAESADLPDARLVIVGPGDPRELQSLARQLGVADRVLLRGPRADIPSLLKAFDVFVHPAIAESFGMVIIEAMAMARPVLCTPVGIAPEVIESGHTGVLCSSPDPLDIARGLRQMIRLRPQWRALGQAARVRVSGFTAARMSQRYVELYRAWLSPPGQLSPDMRGPASP